MSLRKNSKQRKGGYSSNGHHKTRQPRFEQLETRKQLAADGPIECEEVEDVVLAIDAPACEAIMTTVKDFGGLPPSFPAPEYLIAEGTDEEVWGQEHHEVESITTSQLKVDLLQALEDLGRVEIAFSFIPDGTPIPLYGRQVSELFGFFDATIGVELGEYLVRDALGEWSETTAITFVEEPFPDVASVPTVIESDKYLFHILIGGRPIDGDKRILAESFGAPFTTIFLDVSDSHLLRQDDYYRVLRNTLAHEFGHALMLSHVFPANGTKLMEPVLSNEFDGPQHYDIYSVQEIYGDSLEPNDDQSNAILIGSQQSSNEVMVIDAAPHAGPGILIHPRPASNNAWLHDQEAITVPVYLSVEQAGSFVLDILAANDGESDELEIVVNGEQVLHATVPFHVVPGKPGVAWADILEVSAGVVELREGLNEITITATADFYGTEIGGLRLTPASTTPGQIASGGTTTIEHLSIHHEADDDWFKFTVPIGTTGRLTATPIGEELLVGDSPDHTSLINTRLQNDLFIELYTVDGAWNASTDDAAIGEAETIIEIQPGDYLAKVAGHDDGVQLYELAWSVSDSANPAIFYVDSPLDTPDANPGDGIAADAAGRVTPRAAFDEANALLGVQSIVFPEGRFSIGRVGTGDDENTTGDFDITEDLIIVGAGMSQTILDGAEIDRVLDIHQGAEVAIHKIGITGGYVNGDGGGLRNRGTVTFKAASVYGNVADGSGLEGGGIFNDGAMTIMVSDIQSNELSNSTIGGGGIGSSYNRSLTIISSTVANNISSDNGGGLMTSAGGTTLIINSTFSGNLSDRSGGAIFSNGSLTVVNSTITQNESTSSLYGVGGGIFVNTGQAELENTVVAVNSATAGSPDLVGLFTTLGGNLIGEISAGHPDDGTGTRVRVTAEGFTHGQNGDLVGTDVPIDPNLGPLADNGGFTLTHLPQLSSPLIDAGRNEGNPGIGQRGTLRPLDGDGDGTAIVDIGSVEVDSSAINLPDLVVRELRIVEHPTYDIAYEFTVENVGNAAVDLDGRTSANHDNVSVQAFVSADTVFNNSGDIAAGGTILGLSPLGFLSPGETFTGQFGATTSFDVATHPYLTLKVDWNDVVVEQDETNNTLAVRIDNQINTPPFLISTREGLVRVESDGSHHLVLAGIELYHGVEVLPGGRFAVKSGSDIVVYNEDLVEQQRTPIPASLGSMSFVAIDDGRFAMFSNWEDEVYFIDALGTLLHTVKIRSTADSLLQNVDGVQVGNSLIVSEDGNNRVLAIDLATYAVSEFKDLSGFGGWLGVIDHHEGTFFVAQSRRILAFTEDGPTEIVAELPEGNITGLHVDREHNVAYVAINFTGTLFRVDLATGLTSVIASGLDYPSDLERFEPSYPISDEPQLVGLYSFGQGTAENEVSDAEAIPDLEHSGVLFETGNAVLDNHSDYLELPVPLGDEPFTIWLDATYDVSPGHASIFSQGDFSVEGRENWDFGVSQFVISNVSPNRLRSLFFGGEGQFNSIDTGIGEMDGQRRQIALTWDGTEFGAFFDDELTIETPSGTMPDIDGSVVRFGRPVGGVWASTGAIHEIRIYRGALSEAELVELGTSSFGPPSVPEPVAVDDHFEILEDNSAFLRVTDNDIARVGNTVTVESVNTMPQNGVLTSISSDGYTYAPNPNFYGTDTITYVVTDGVNDSNVATVTISVQPVNDAPILSAPVDIVVSDDAGEQSIAFHVAAGGGELQELEVTASLNKAGVITDPAIQYAQGAPTAEIVFSPIAAGITTVTAQVRDAGLDGVLGNGDDAIVSADFDVTVKASNRAPVAVDDEFLVIEGSAIVMHVVDNDSDLDGDELVVELMDAPKHGLVTLNSPTSFHYQVDTHFRGTDELRYRVSDGSLVSNTATATIRVQPVNVPPWMDPIAEPAPIFENALDQVVTLTGITAGYAEPEDLLITATSNNPALVPNPAVVHNTGDTTAELRYAPAANMTGSADITVRLRDSGVDGILGNADDATTARSFRVVVEEPSGPVIHAGVVRSGAGELLDQSRKSLQLGRWLINTNHDREDEIAFDFGFTDETIVNPSGSAHRVLAMRTGASGIANPASVELTPLSVPVEVAGRFLLLIDTDPVDNGRDQRGDQDAEIIFCFGNHLDSQGQPTRAIIRAADVNGDGRDDLVLIQPVGDPDPTVGLRLLEWEVLYAKDFPVPVDQLAGGPFPIIDVDDPRVEVLGKFGFEGDDPFLVDSDGDGRQDNFAIRSQLPVDGVAQWFVSHPHRGIEVVGFGDADGTALVGNIDGGPTDLIMVTATGDQLTWEIDSNLDGVADEQFIFGEAGDVPFYAQPADPPNVVFDYDVNSVQPVQFDPGDLVTLIGQHLQDLINVYLFGATGGQQVPVTSASDGQATFQAPAGTGHGAPMLLLSEQSGTLTGAGVVVRGELEDIAPGVQRNTDGSVHIIAPDTAFSDAGGSGLWFVGSNASLTLTDAQGAHVVAEYGSEITVGAGAATVYPEFHASVDTSGAPASEITVVYRVQLTHLEEESNGTQPPDGAADTYATEVNKQLSKSPTEGVLANDVSNDGTWEVQVETWPQNGTLDLNLDGSFVYTPNPEFLGVDNFSYVVSDANASSLPIDVEINVLPGSHGIHTEMEEVPAGGLTSEAPTPPFHNSVNPRDVNNDGVVTPIDVLSVISVLNSGTTLDASAQPRFFYDTSGDGVLTPFDVLIVINSLNDAAAEGEGLAAEQQVLAVDLCPATSLSAVDTELSQARKSVAEVSVEDIASALTQAISGSEKRQPQSVGQIWEEPDELLDLEFIDELVDALERARQ